MFPNRGVTDRIFGRCGAAVKLHIWLGRRPRGWSLPVFGSDLTPVAKLSPPTGAGYEIELIRLSDAAHIGHEFCERHYLRAQVIAGLRAVRTVGIARWKRLHLRSSSKVFASPSRPAQTSRAHKLLYVLPANFRIATMAEERCRIVRASMKDRPVARRTGDLDHRRR
jgi:hypothetical protein